MYQYGDYTIQQARDGDAYVRNSQGRIVVKAETTRAAEEWIEAQMEDGQRDN